VTGAFANLGRVYLGGHASVGYRGFDQDQLPLFDGAYDLGPLRGLQPNLAVQGGALLFRRGTARPHLRLQVDLRQEVPQLFVSAAYHFLQSP
jgi:hypothetical protein